MASPKEIIKKRDHKERGMMPKLACSATSTVVAALTAFVLLPILAHSCQARGWVRPNHRPHRVTRAKAVEPIVQSKLLYRDFWPEMIPIVITYRDGHQSIVQMNGKTYWAMLPAATRVKLDTLNKLQGYCQVHEGS